MSECNEIVMQKYELKSLRQERDALQAQVAVLRGVLLNNRIKFCEKFDNRKNHSTICYPPWGNICEELENCEEIERILSTTPSEAAERVNGLVEALEFYEKFEIDIMSDEGEKARKALATWRGQEN